MCISQVYKNNTKCIIIYGQDYCPYLLESRLQRSHGQLQYDDRRKQYSPVWSKQLQNIKLPLGFRWFANHAQVLRPFCGCLITPSAR